MNMNRRKELSYLKREHLIKVVPQRTRSCSCGDSKVKFSFIATVSFVSLLFISLKLTGFRISTQEQSHDDHDAVFICPATVQKSANDRNEFTTEFYKKRNSKIDPNDCSFEALKNTNYDGWGITYDGMKKLQYDWKRTYFSSLQPGDTLFESACGQGLNLVMTVEILSESIGIRNLSIYGIEYLQKSVSVANQILAQQLPFAGSKLGSPICQADATDLYIVPANTFDLAYTGYIDPIQDPLNLEKQLGRKPTWKDFCVSHANMTESGELNQAAVEDWYAAWVSELIRITKPGKSVIVEQVSLPKCENNSDWGGVAKRWWTRAIKKYQWDVESESLVTDDLNSKERRYNVYMKKRMHASKHESNKVIVV